MNNYITTYTLTTFNKLPYLKITLPWWVQTIQSNEELVIIDGGSTDGSIEFIHEMVKPYSNIHFISEKDCGEAHGLNKAILLSNGKYIKIISDDDTYNILAIRKAIEWMEQNPEIDIVGSNGFAINFKNYSSSKQFTLKNEEVYFQQYKMHQKPFIVTGLSYLIRKASIPKLGLFNTAVKIVDFEYSLRVLSNQCVKFALCTTPFYVNIVNPSSNSHTMFRHLINEYSKWYSIYYGKTLKEQVWKIKLWLSYYLSSFKQSDALDKEHFNYEKIFTDALDHLHSCNQNEFKILK